MAVSNKRPAAVAAPAATVTVRTAGAHRRYRAGLGPFGPEPVAVAATMDQIAALQADPGLVVVVAE